MADTSKAFGIFRNFQISRFFVVQIESLQSFLVREHSVRYCWVGVQVVAGRLKMNGRRMGRNQISRLRSGGLARTTRCARLCRPLACVNGTRPAVLGRCFEMCS